MTLRDVKVDQTVSVVKLHGEGAKKEELWIWESQKEPAFMSVK